MEIDYGDKILNTSMIMFRQYGLVSVSMEDLAHELHMSKKSIYEEYSSKNEIILNLAQRFFEEHKLQLQKENSFENAAAEFVHITKYCMELFGAFSPKILYDIQKKYPEVWVMFLEHKNTAILKKVKNNFENGIKEGVYRTEINADVSSKVFIQQFQLAFDSLNFPKHEYDSQDVLNVMMKNHFYSLATPATAEAYGNQL